MSKRVEQFFILISAPSDIQEEIKIVKETIDRFNRIVGAKNNINLITKYWGDDAFPEMGDTPQNLLNKQIVDDSDAIIAIFWTRFGSPTKNYGSGTEEEIIRLKDAGKQVFLYFSDCKADLKNVDMTQYNNVKKFMKKHKNDSLYFTYDNLNKFSELLYDHLTNYFSSSLIIKKHSTFEIKCLNNDKVSDNLVFYNMDLLNTDNIKQLRNKIVDYFTTINKCELNKSEEINILPSKTFNLGLITEYQKMSYIKIDIDIENTITEYAKINKIEINNNFFDVGNLKKPQLSLVGNERIKGSDSEIKKYKMIENLYRNILALNEFIKYFEIIDKYSCLDLIIINNGEIPDKNIDIILYLPKNKLISFDNFPAPDYPCIEEINNIGSDFFEILFTLEETHLIKKYDNYNFYSTINNYSYLIGNHREKSSDEIIAEEQKKYNNHLKEFFIYEYYSKDDKDIIKFNIKYLKHNESMHFPTTLFFNEKVDTLEYEIKGENNPKIISGKLEKIK